MNASSSSPARHPLVPLVAVSLVGAPLLMLVADATAAALELEGFWITAMSMWCSFLLFVVAIAGLATVSTRRAPRSAALGGALAICGSLIGITINGLERMRWSMLQHGIDAELAREVIMDPWVFFTSRAPGLTFPIGLLILAWAARRADSLTRREAVLLALGAFLFPAGRIALGVKVNVVSDVLMLAALAPVGLRWLRSGPMPAGDAEPSRSSTATPV